MKQCVMCGEDCSGKPRTKDRQGRYYCQSCHDAALAKKNASAGAGAEAVGAGASSASGALSLDAGPGSADDPGLDIMSSILDAAPTAGSAAPPPPPAATGGGSQDDRIMGLEAAPPRPPTAPSPLTMYSAGRSDPEPSGMGWALGLGLPALIWGGLELLVFASQFIVGATDSTGGSARIGNMVIGGIGATFAISAVVGGIGCLSRRQSAIGKLKFWAWGRIFVIAIFAMLLGGAAMKTGATQNVYGRGALAQLIVMLIVAGIPSLICIFLLNRRSCQNAVDGWKR